MLWATTYEKGFPLSLGRGEGRQALGWAVE